MLQAPERSVAHLFAAVSPAVAMVLRALEAFDIKKHARWPKGHPSAGKFRPMPDLLKKALRDFDGEGHPFDSFNRDQLMRAAKAMEIPLSRGESWDSIAGKVFAKLDPKGNFRHDLDEIQAKNAGKGGIESAGATDRLASVFHENWRASRAQSDGGFEPRVKTTKDAKWKAKHGTDQVDIANTPFEDLPEDWQAENRAAAKVVVDLMRTRGGNLSREQAGAAIHDAWLERNEWARGGDLDVPFAKLPKDEQDKDVEQYNAAVKLFGSGGGSGIQPKSTGKGGAGADSPEFEAERAAWLEENSTWGKLPQWKIDEEAARLGVNLSDFPRMKSIGGDDLGPSRAAMIDAVIAARLGERATKGNRAADADGLDDLTDPQSRTSTDWRAEAPMRKRTLGGSTQQKMVPDLEVEWPGPSKLSPERQTQAESGLRDAVASLQAGPGEWVRMSRIRDDMAAKGFTRGEQDAALDALASQPDVRVIPIANLKSLTEDDYRAAAMLGGEFKHAIAIDGSRGGSGHGAVNAPPSGPSPAAIAALRQDLAGATPGSADHKRITKMLADMEGAKPARTRAPKAAAAEVAAGGRTAAQMIADPQPGDREAMKGLLSKMTITQLGDFARAHGAELEKAGDKEHRRNRLVEWLIGGQLNRKAIQSGIKSDSERDWQKLSAGMTGVPGRAQGGSRAGLKVAAADAIANPTGPMPADDVLNTMTIKQLKDFHEQRTGSKLSGVTRKADIIAAVKAR